MSIFYRKEFYREKLFLKNLHLKACRKKLQTLFTDNVEYVKRGAVGKYNNCYLRMSNNLYKFQNGICGYAPQGSIGSSGKDGYSVHYSSFDSSDVSIISKASFCSFWSTFGTIGGTRKELNEYLLGDE